MALVVGGVAVDLSANAAQIVGAMNQAAAAVNKAAGQMQNSSSRFASSFNAAERRINASIGRIGSGFRSLQGLLAAAGLGLGVREIIRMGDAYKLAGAQLRLVSASGADAAAVQERLFQSAQDLGVGVGTLNTIYIRASRNAATLGASQDEIFRATEALGAAIKVSGASAQEASSALFQLSQSFARGVLRGEELNSVSEQMPIILDAIAAATGKSTQEVIRFATENGLAADLVIESVVRMRDTWVRQAATMANTVEAAMERVRNAIERVAGKAGEKGAFDPLIESLDALAAKLASGETINAIKSFFDEMDRRWQSTAREAARFGYIVSAIMEGRFTDAMDAATGKLKEFEESFTKITREQALALGVPIPLPRRPITPTPTGQGEKLDLRGGEDDASAKKAAAAAARLAKNIQDARDSIATLVVSGDEFVQIQQQVDNKARQLGETFRNFSKFIKDPDERLKAFNATMAALAVEQEAANKKIQETIRSLTLISQTAGLGNLDFGDQEIRDAVTELGAMASANDKVFATQLALAQSTDKLGELFQTLSLAMKDAGASAEEIDKLRGVILSAQAGAEAAAAEAAAAPGLEAHKAAVEALQEKYKVLTSVAENFAQNIAKGFTDAIFGAQTFGEALRGILQSLAEAIVQAVILQAVTSAIGGVGAGGLLGAIFPAPAPRALGGPVGAFRPYLVGERGPELFVPSRAGQIMPNNQLGGGGSVINIDARQSTPGTAAAAVAQAVRLAPNAVVNAQARGQMSRGRAPF